jgi:hypothetical protein
MATKKSTKKRTQVKTLPKSKKSLTSEEKKKIRGGGINRIVVTDGNIKS